MKIVFLIILGVLSVGTLWVFREYVARNVNVVLRNASFSNQEASVIIVPTPFVEMPTDGTVPQNGFLSPLDRVAERVTKKSFGVYVTPDNSPVQPERFSGYHTGTDFEIFSDELNVPVAVRAVCTGAVLLKQLAYGYGGVVVQSCTLDGQPITVVYGHVRLASIGVKVGDTVQAGDMLGVLGTAHSRETDGERKHLHISFHWGKAVNILGYVSNKERLSEWIDPCQYVCR